MPTRNMYSEDNGTIVERSKKKKIFFKAIYTLTPSLGALGNVNLSSHYKMYLSVTKINSVILGGCCIHRDDSLFPPETAGFSHHF